MGVIGEFFSREDRFASRSHRESSEGGERRVTAIEALEDYSAHHSETVEELLNWPWKRFEAFYIAFLKRRSVVELEDRKLALTTGIWANDGLNDEKGTRTQALEQLDSQFKEAARVVYMRRKDQEAMRDQHRFTEEDEENPFLRPAIEATRRLDTPRNDEGTVKEAITKDDPRKDLDQL